MGNRRKAITHSAVFIALAKLLYEGETIMRKILKRVIALVIIAGITGGIAVPATAADGGCPQIRAIQQKLNNNYSSHIELLRVDGIYGGNTHRALIRALQAEAGLPADMASNHFGPATRAHMPQIPYDRDDPAAARCYNGELYTDEQVSVFTELLQFALFVNGFGGGTMDGVFTDGTAQDLRAFQEFRALEVTGTAYLGVWWALLTSHGDPDRPATGADCAMILTAARAQTLYDHGYRIVGRYLTNFPGGMDKAITREEAQIILGAGLSFFPIYQAQRSPVRAGYFTEAQGISDAEAAAAAAMALGIPAGTYIYFAVDFDVSNNEITANILPYFKGIHGIMSDGTYKTGIYGPRNACIRVAEAGYSANSFVANMSNSFAGNLGFPMPADWAFDQFANLEGENALGSGNGRIEIDRNAVSGRDLGVSRLEPPSIPCDPPPPHHLDSASSWAREGIAGAIGKGFVPEDIQGSYTAVITRAEFCRMAVRWGEYAAGKEVYDLLSDSVLPLWNPFDDTDDPDILAAYHLGITSGTSDTTFSPDGSFTREQAATMIRNTLRAIGMDVTDPPPSGFADIEAASGWAVPGIDFVRAHGIMQGVSTDPPRFDPKAPYTREQSIVTFDNIKAGELFNRGACSE
jgi:peptidoglycan hydrolase-like protein with peptidoglycan-binding domain